MANLDYFVRDTCRLCDGTELRMGVDFNDTPAANEFVENPVTQDLFPLSVWQCRTCGHNQLRTVVNPERLFRNYVYVSGTSPSFVKHFVSYAKMVDEDYLNDKASLIVEIGSNDGTLLNEFKKLGYGNLCGFEPASKIAKEATEKYGVKTIPEFFDSNSITCLEPGSARVVIANNVFAHADNLREITQCIESILHAEGVFIFEVSYFVDVLKDCLFDTVYHEHLAFHTLAPLVTFFRKHGLQLFDAERVNTHGGSIRCYVDKTYRPISDRLSHLIESEKELGLVVGDSRFSLFSLTHFSDQIDIIRQSLVFRLRELRFEGKTVAAYGAPAKATTLMYEFGLTSADIQYIIDDSPWKQGLLSPGKHIKVLSSEALKTRRPDYLLILAWNFADAIIAKNKEFSDAGGKFIVPIPVLKEI